MALSINKRISFSTSNYSDIVIDYPYNDFYYSNLEATKKLTVSITPHFTNTWSWNDIAYTAFTLTKNADGTVSLRPIWDLFPSVINHIIFTSSRTETIEVDLSRMNLTGNQYFVLGFDHYQESSSSDRSAQSFFVIGAEDSDTSIRYHNYYIEDIQINYTRDIIATYPPEPTITVESSGEQLGVDIDYAVHYKLVPSAYTRHLVIKNVEVVVAELDLPNDEGTYNGTITVDPHVNTTLTFILNDEFNAVTVSKVVKRKQVVWDAFDDGEHVAFYVGAEVPDFISQNLFKVNMDSEFVGNVKAPNLLKVVEQQLFDNKTISGSGTDSGYVSVDVEGYIPIGVLGYRIFNASSSGINSVTCHPTQICIMNNQVRYYVANRGSSSAKIQMIAYVLCMYGG